MHILSIFSNSDLRPCKGAGVKKQEQGQEPLSSSNPPDDRGYLQRVPSHIVFSTVGGHA